VKLKLSEAVDLYLQTRRSFGFALVKDEVELRSFVRHAEQTGHTWPLTASLATQWAQQPEHCDRVYWAIRLGMIRRFAQFCLPYEPATEVPPPGQFGPITRRRRAVHIYSREEVGMLLEAAGQIGLHPLQRSTFVTVIGLLDCTGLRISEALGLSDRDIDWSAGVLNIRHGKNGHARLIPVHPSTLEALQGYRVVRDDAIGVGLSSRLFVNAGGSALSYAGVSRPFRKLCRRLGWTQVPVPRLHDLRHAFAVHTLLAWYRSGEPVGPKLWTLSTYLGHRHLAETYWYLTAVPELMELCHARFASAQTWASGGTAHE
jgi:integrase